MTKKKKLLLAGIPVLLAASYFLVFFVFHEDAKAPTAIDEGTPATAEVVKPTEDVVEATPVAVEQIIYPVVLSMDQAASITAVVNKKHKLPEGYAPALVAVAGGKMRQEAATELQKLLDAAIVAGNSIKILSSYRSYNTQVSTYNGYVAQYGQAQADTFSARPGHSEHQTGLAVDLGNSNGLCTFEVCFGDTPGGAWLASNAASYGFIVRYPQGMDAETGYQYEPWHLRFVGVATAKAIVASEKTLDQYYGVVAGGY